MKAKLSIAVAFLLMAGARTATAADLAFVVRGDFPQMEGTPLLYNAARIIQVGGLVPEADLLIDDSCSLVFPPGAYVARKVTFVLERATAERYGVDPRQKGVIYFHPAADPGRDRNASLGYPTECEAFGGWQGLVGETVIDCRSLNIISVHDL